MRDDLDLSPRTGPGDGPPPATRPGGARRWVGIAVIVGVLAVGAFAVSQALGDATLFFRNADEAVAQRDELAGERFRLQGLVVPGTIEAYPSGVAFEVTYNGVAVPVEHTGDPEELFQEDVPVVLEGQWSGTSDDAVFLSDRMLVRHDENYDAENPDRVATADSGGDGGAAAEVMGGDGGAAAEATGGDGGAAAEVMGGDGGAAAEVMGGDGGAAAEATGGDGATAGDGTAGDGEGDGS